MRKARANDQIRFANATSEPLNSLEMEANHPDDSHIITFLLIPSSVEFFLQISKSQTERFEWTPS
jgi:hypothetical protein